MPLSEKIRTESLQALLESLGKDPAPEHIQLLTAVNKLAAEDDVPLDSQGKFITDYLIKRVKAAVIKEDSELEEFSLRIYLGVVAEMDKQTIENQRIHNARGGYDVVPIHRRSHHDQLQDHDMTLIMPKPNSNTDVLAVLDASLKDSINLIKQAVKESITNSTVKHIIIPIGPGHWRGIYITKPSDSAGKYTLELFDPYGPIGARAITDLAYDILKECKIEKDQIAIQYSGPDKPQKDYYACGDFTCAFSHKKMKEFGAQASEYRTDLIEVLDTKGNDKSALRNKVIDVSKELAPPIAASSSRSSSTTTQAQTNTKNVSPPIKKAEASTKTAEPIAPKTTALESPQEKNDKEKVASLVGGFFPNQSSGAKKKDLPKANTTSQTKRPEVFATQSKVQKKPAEKIVYQSYAEEREALQKENEEKLKNLQELVGNATISYVEHSTNIWFSIFHRHGETGRIRASAFNRSFARATAIHVERDRLTQFLDAGERLIQFLTDDTKGNRNPHSYRTMLLRELVKTDKVKPSLDEVSKQFDKLLNQLAKDLGVDLKPGIDLRIK